MSAALSVVCWPSLRRLRPRARRCAPYVFWVAPADISRPRKFKKNAAPVAVGKKRSHMAGRSAHNPKSTSPYQRAREHLTVSCGKLFCSGCREELGLKLTVIRLHIKSKKHQAGKERLQSNEAHERDIATSFAMYCDMRIENNTRFAEHNCCLRICEDTRIE